MHAFCIKKINMYKTIMNIDRILRVGSLNEWIKLGRITLRNVLVIFRTTDVFF